MDRAGDRDRDRAADSVRLAAIRRRVAALAGARWMLSTDGDETLLDTCGRDGSIVAIARFAALASPEELEIVAAAPEDLRFLLDLVDRAIASARRERGRHAPPAQENRAPDHTTEAAMLCADPAFKRWLIDCHGLESPATDERAAARLRSLLGVTSRKEINQTEDARARWIALRDEFGAWKRRAA